MMNELIEEYKEELQSTINRCLEFPKITTSNQYMVAVWDRMYLEDADPDLCLTSTPFYDHLVNEIHNYKQNN